MSMEQNQLTRDLYAAGYTREDHPSFVYWSDWQNFGYLFEALLKFTWETPCGLLVDGKSDLGRDLELLPVKRTEKKYKIFPASS